MTNPLFPSSLLAPLYSTEDMRAVLDDRARVQRMLDFEAALARAEAAVGIVPPNPASIIVEACRAELYDLGALAEGIVPAGNPAIPLVDALTAEVSKRNKKAAAFVHWGASSQDVIDTAMVLELRAVIDTLFKDLDRATKAFTALAGRHRRNMTVARTQLQQALPMPFGLKLAGYAAALARSRDRLRRLRKEVLVLQFGGSAGTLAALAEKGLDVSERLAAQLDLMVPDGPWHTHRDRFAEVAATLAILAGTCGKIARDVALLMQSEVGEAFEAPTPGRSGSLPNKHNPVGAAAALSAATIAPNLASTILNAQFQEHEGSVGGWQAEWVTFPALALVVSGSLRAAVNIAEGLTVDVERMKANLEASGGLVLAEAVSFALAEKLGRTDAQELVADLSRQAARDKRAFKDIVAESDKIKPHISANEIERLFMPNHYQGSAQTFIDRLVASAQGRAVRRSSSVSHLTEPKLPTARTDHLSAIRAATIPATTSVPASETLAAVSAAVIPETAATIPAAAKTTADASTEQLGQAVEAASALIAQTISELAKPTSPPQQAEPAVEQPVVAEATPEPVIEAEPLQASAPVEEPAPTLEIAATEPEPPIEPAVIADAPPLDEPDDAPGALLEVFARAAETENADADEPAPEHKPA